MASIRRTLSPVPRPGARMNGEAGSMASPLSKSTSSSPSYPQSSGLSYSSTNSLGYALYQMHSYVLGLFSHRASRPLERSKSKGQVWKRVVLHFALCFIVGVFVGLTPFASMNLSANLMSKRQTLFMDMRPSVAIHRGKDYGIGTTASVVQTNPDSVMPLAEKPNMYNDSLRELHERKSELTLEIHEERVAAELPKEEPIREIRKPLIIVTPTSTQPMQAYYLNRLGQTLKLVRPPLLWVAVEMTSQSAETADILRRTGVMYRHLVCSKNVTGMKDRKVHLRNVALTHIETHHLDGIVYFADDTNVYSVDLFEQLRQIRRLGTWNVAKLFASKRVVLLHGPVCNGTEVIGWNTNERNRRFYADFSGFAFNSTILWDPKRWHRPTLESIRHIDNLKERFQKSVLAISRVTDLIGLRILVGDNDRVQVNKMLYMKGCPKLYSGTTGNMFMVSAFIEQIVEEESQMEGLMQGCTNIMVWHVPLESSFYLYPHQWITSRYLESTSPVM